MDTKTDDIVIKHRIPAPKGGTDRIVVQVISWTGLWQREVVLPERCYAGDFVSVSGASGLLVWDEPEHEWQSLFKDITCGRAPPHNHAEFSAERLVDEARFPVADGWEKAK